MNPKDNMIDWYLKTSYTDKLEYFYNMGLDDLEEWIKKVSVSMYEEKPYYIYNSLYDITTTIRYCKFVRS